MVAIVNGTQIHKHELEAAQQHLPEQYRQVPLQMIYDPLLEQVISSSSCWPRPPRRSWRTSPRCRQEIARARDDVLRNSLLQQAIGKGTTEDKLQAAYDAQKSQPGFAAEEVHAQHILVGRRGRGARRSSPQLDKGGGFRQLAKDKSTDPSAQENGGDLGYFKPRRDGARVLRGRVQDAARHVSKEPVKSSSAGT